MIIPTENIVSRQNFYSSRKILISLLANWPSVGAIQFKDVKMRYREGLDLVLQGVSLDINVRLASYRAVHANFL